MGCYAAYRYNRIARQNQPASVSQLPIRRGSSQKYLKRKASQVGNLAYAAEGLRGVGLWHSGGAQD